MSHFAPPHMPCGIFSGLTIFTTSVLIQMVQPFLNYLQKGKEKNRHLLYNQIAIVGHS